MGCSWCKAITQPNGEKVPETCVFTNRPPPGQAAAQDGCEMQPGRQASEVVPGPALEPRLAPSELWRPRAEQATAGRQVTLRGQSHREGQAKPSHTLRILGPLASQL